MEHSLVTGGTTIRRLGVAVALALTCAGPGAGAAEAKGRRFGSPCTGGETAWGGVPLVCEGGTFRYGLPSDFPPVDGGALTRPDWFPRLSESLVAADPPACPLAGRVTFTSPVIAAGDLSPIIPQGMMVSDHVQPIDHGYFGVRPLAKAMSARTEDDYVAVRAPADGEILEVGLLGGSATSIRVVMAHGCETYSIYMVLNRLSGALAHLQDELLAQGSLRPGLRILAGDEFGRQRDNPLDFSVHDGSTWLSGYVSPYSYATSETWRPFTVDPWPYFSPDLAELYRSYMQRTTEPRWGRIDQDVRGTAAGGWFLDGTAGYSGTPLDVLRAPTGPIRGGMVEGKATYAWSHLAIARHWVQPDHWVFSTGWWRDERGDPRQFLIDRTANQLEPDQLSSAHGITVYRLRQWNPSTPAENQAPHPVGYSLVMRDTAGFVAVQVHEDDSISLEVFPGVSDAPAATTLGPARRLYRR